MLRTIKQDTQAIKADLGGLIKAGEAMVRRHEDNPIGGMVELLRFSAHLFVIHDKYKRLREEIDSDQSIALTTDKNKYFGETILEGAGYLGRTIIEKYVK